MEIIFYVTLRIAHSWVLAFRLTSMAHRKRDFLTKSKGAL